MNGRHFDPFGLDGIVFDQRRLVLFVPAVEAEKSKKELVRVTVVSAGQGRDKFHILVVEHIGDIKAVGFEEFFLNIYLELLGCGVFKFDALPNAGLEMLFRDNVFFVGFVQGNDKLDRPGIGDEAYLFHQRGGIELCFIQQDDGDAG